jgi:hypothetical protein
MILQFQERNKDRCHGIQYEHLVLDPLDACNRLFSFLNLESFEKDSESALWDIVFGIPHQRVEKGGDFKADRSKTVDKSRIGTGRDINAKKIDLETQTRVRMLQDRIGYSVSSLNRFYVGGFVNEGKGTPEGDGKDKAMRVVASRAIVELADDRPSSSRTTRDTLGLYEGGCGITVMLARNGGLKGQPLRDETKATVCRAKESGCVFVVGDMPGVDSQFISLLDEIGAIYTIYYSLDRCRVKEDLETVFSDNAVDV